MFLVFLFTQHLVSLAQNDSLLSTSRFFEAIARYHPLVKQAGLLSESAQKELMMSRGNFDPKIAASFYRKSFDGKDYYTLFNPELKIPTWTGLDFKAGLERNVGTYVSQEHRTPKNGLQYLGLSIPIGQGLMTDSRRTTLKQAKIGIQMAEAERNKQVNKILISAAKDYWDWFFSVAQLQNAELAFKLASERYKGIKQRIKIGEQAPFDSIEALIFQQDRDVFLRQSRYDELNSRLQLSTYLWNENEQPVDLVEGIRPGLPPANNQFLSDSIVTDLVRLSASQHPEIQNINFKINQIELDQKLGKEMLKPLFNLHYSWLSRTDSSIWGWNSLDRNYKLGFDFAMPILLRKERGKLELVKIKIRQAQLELEQKKRDIQIQIQTSYNDLRILQDQIGIQQYMVLNYQKLRDGELKKLENGESSLFLINTRESKLIEARIKLASLISKYQKERSHILYAAGRNPILSYP